MSTVLPANSWTVGKRITAADLNLLTTVANSLLQAPVFDYANHATQAIATGQWTAVTLDTQLRDDAAVFNSAQPTRFTPSRAGLYQVIARGAVSGGTTGDRAVSIQTNGGGDYLNRQVIAPDSAAPWHDQCIDMIYLNGTTDYAELMVYQSSGSALNTVADACRLTATWVRA